MITVFPIYANRSLFSTRSLKNYPSSIPIISYPWIYDHTSSTVEQGMAGIMVLS
jgi:hypothetical protein